MARKRQLNNIPTFDELIIPTMKALKILGGSGTIDEINEKVYEIAEIPEEILQFPHDENGLTSEVDYRLAWSRTYLKKFGLLDNSTRGVWSLSKADINIEKLSSDEIVKMVRDLHKPKKQNPETSNDPELIEQIEDLTDWKETLLNILFTRDAIKEATRDGAPPIDLIDGDLLCEKLKEYKLGVETTVIEKHDIISEWFAKL